jgi:hypothetical protein
MDAQLRRYTSGTATKMDDKIMHLMSNVMRAKAESKLTQAADAVATAEDDLEAAKAALAEAERRGDRAELHAFRVAVDAARRRKEAETTVYGYIRSEAKLEATVKALREEMGHTGGDLDTSFKVPNGNAWSSAAAAISAVSALGAISDKHTTAEYDPAYVAMVLHQDAAVGRCRLNQVDP